MQPTLLFAYGTLLHPTGHPEVDRGLADCARDLGEAYMDGDLYHVGAYPAAIIPEAPGEAKVLGRLLEIIHPQRLLPILDAYEDFDPRRPDLAEFAPRTVSVFWRGQTVRALTYLYQRSVAGLARIPEGDWRAWRASSPGIPARMVSAAQAEGLIARSLRNYGTCSVTLAEAAGRVLAEAIPADRDFPPYDRMAMDGIAVSGSAWEEGRREFAVLGSQLAGEAPRKLPRQDGCFLAMTGAALPEGCDRVIRIEDIVLSADGASRKALAAPGIVCGAWKNIHRRGSDKKEGDTLLAAGSLLRGPEIGIAASAGRESLLVFRRPRVALVTTGDELVPIADRPLDYQVRLSNGPALAAALQGVAESLHARHIRDDAASLEKGLAEAAADADLILVTGGVSMGEKDLVPGALRAIGVNEVFHKVRQKPGKPLWYGLTGDATPGGAGRQVFGLPGNPVSVLLCFRYYVLPVLRRASGHCPEAPETAWLDAPCKRGPENFLLLLPCRARREDTGRLRVMPIAHQGSGDFAALAGTDGFFALEARDPSDDKDAFFPVGYTVRFFPWLSA